VDLKGHTYGARPGILAQRPAPVQVNYLGYPGTTAAPFIDYIIADPIVIPEKNRVFYSEKVAYLPNAYLPYDRHREIATKKPSRAKQGLPETGFVFACFNSLYKLTPDIFAIWLRLLQGVDGSVLWLGASSAAAKNNMHHAAQARGVDPKRLVFARFTPSTPDFLARHRLADLFLDTLPYNAHATAANALGAGLPVLTCKGEAFAGRVAASLLEAAGLPELVTESLEAYEARALELARDPAQLQALKEKLALPTAALFDTGRFARNIEAAYVTMSEQRASPRSFSVPS